MTQRAAGGLFDHEGAEITQVSDGANRFVWPYTLSGLASQRLKESPRLRAIVIAVDFQVTGHCPPPGRSRLAGLYRVAEGGPALCAVSRRFDGPILDLPFAWTEAGQEQWINGSPSASHYRTEIPKSPIKGEYLNQHSEARNDADGFEGEPFLRNASAGICSLHLVPPPLRLAFVGIQQAGDRLVPPATCRWISDAERVLQHATRLRLAAPETERSTFLDFVALLCDRLQLGPENIEH